MKKTKTEEVQSTLAEDAAELLEATADPIVAQAQVPQQSAENIAQSQPPKVRYYHAMNSTRIFKQNGLLLRFSPYFHGATWFGTFATEEPTEIAALDAIVKQNIGVEDLSPEDYENCLKKKAHTLSGLGTSLIHSETQSQSRQHASLAGVVDSEPLPPPPAAPPVEGVASLALGESKMPETVN
jgi:hypothetical protein